MAIDDRDRERTHEGEGFFERAWRRLNQRTQGDEPDEDRRRRESPERQSQWSGAGSSFYGPSGTDYNRSRGMGESATQGSYGMGGYSTGGSGSGQSYGSTGYQPSAPSQGYGGGRYGGPEYGGGYQRAGSYGEPGREAGREYGRDLRDWGREPSTREGGSEYGGYGPSEGRVARRWRREPVKASEIMTAEIKFVSPETSLRDIAIMMKDENVGAVPVVGENRKLLGMITDRDIVVRAAAESRSFDESRARDIMTTDIEAVTSNEDIRDVIELMGRHQVRRVPVVDREDRLLGIIAIADVASRADYDEDLQQALERISSRRSFWSRLWT